MVYIYIYTHVRISIWCFIKGSIIVCFVYVCICICCFCPHMYIWSLSLYIYICVHMYICMMFNNEHEMIIPIDIGDFFQMGWNWNYQSIKAWMLLHHMFLGVTSCREPHKSANGTWSKSDVLHVWETSNFLTYVFDFKTAQHALSCRVFMKIMIDQPTEDDPQIDWRDYFYQALVVGLSSG